MQNKGSNMQNKGFTAGLKGEGNLKWQMQGCFSLANQFVTEMEYFVPKFSVVRSPRLDLS